VFTLSYSVFVPTVSVRLSEAELAALDEAADLLDQDRSTTIRKALDEGVGELRVRHAVERYQGGDASVNEAAALAGVSIGEWLEIAHARNLTTHFEADELRFDAERAREL
jgi:predicted HTH domain antitoxin